MHRCHKNIYIIRSEWENGVWKSILYSGISQEMQNGYDRMKYISNKWREVSDYDWYEINWIFFKMKNKKNI